MFITRRWIIITASVPGMDSIAGTRRRKMAAAVFFQQAATRWTQCFFCMGSDVEEVTAYETTSKNEIFQKYEYATTTVAMLKFANGAIGKVASVIDCLQPYYFHAHLIGSEGSILDNKLYSSKLGLRDKKWAELPMAMADSGDVADHPYQDQFQAFFDATDKGEDSPLTGMKTAYETFRVLFACDKSAAEGRPVKLSEFE